MLFIEYDVGAEGAIEVVALINAQEENGEDPSGEAWGGAHPSMTTEWDA